MERTISKISKCCIVCLLLSLLITGCMNDNIVQDPGHGHEHNSIKYVSIKELPQIIPQIEAFNKSYQYLSKSVNPESEGIEDDFNLDLERILVYTKSDSLKSYSINILNEIPEDEPYYFENLHIIENSTGNEILVCRWTPDNSGLSFLLNSFSGKLEIFDVNYSLLKTDIFNNGIASNPFANKSNDDGPKETVQITCSSIVTCNCTGDPFYCGCVQGYDSCKFVLNIVCGVGNTGGGGGGTGTGGSTGGGGGTSPTPPTTPPVEVVPNPPVGEAADNPCTSLKTKFYNTVFKNKIASLNTTTAFTSDKESGFIENRIQTNNVYSTIPNYVNVYPTILNNEIDIPPSLKLIAFAHVHNNDYYKNGKLIRTVKMFSPQDLNAFLTNCQTNATNAGLTYNDTYSIMLSSEGVFALKMLKQPTTSLSRLQYFNFKKDFNDEIQEFATEEKLNSTNLQKLFLKLLMKYKLETTVGLYKATNAELTQWSWIKTVINDNIVAIPCN